MRNEIPTMIPMSIMRMGVPRQRIRRDCVLMCHSLLMFFLRLTELARPASRYVHGAYISVNERGLNFLESAHIWIDGHVLSVL